MSDVPKAREIILMVLKMFDLDPAVRRYLHKALALMTREKAIRRARGVRTKISADTRRKIHTMALTEMTMHEIAEHTGVHNIGRISEVLNRKR